MTDHDVEKERARWNERFRKPRDFKATANDWLVTMVAGRTPGAAVDLCTGQGRNALYLARLGWRVIGIDLSDEGLRLAREAAAHEQLELELIHADLDHYELGRERFDLATMIYSGDEAPVAEHARDSLRSGGLFLLEFFSADSPSAKVAGSWKRGQLADMFRDGFTILCDDEVEDVADWGLETDKLVRFAAEKT